MLVAADGRGGTSGRGSQPMVVAALCRSMVAAALQTSVLQSTLPAYLFKGAAEHIAKGRNFDPVETRQL